MVKTQTYWKAKSEEGHGSNCHWSAGSWNDRRKFTHKLHSGMPTTALLGRGADALAEQGEGDSVKAAC